MLPKSGELVLLVSISVLLAFCLGCDQALKSGEAQAAVGTAPPSSEVVLASLPSLHQPSEKVETSLSFLKAAPPETANDQAQLSFEVAGGPGGRETMELSDPENPAGTSVKLKCCTVKLEPRICTANTQGRDKCTAYGGYALDITDANGKAMGTFVIDHCGALGLAANSRVTDYAAQLTFSRNVGVAKTRYMIYPKRAQAGKKHQAVLAVEYECNDSVTAHEFDSPDGWHYTYQFPDGNLRIYPPEAINALRDEVAADNRVASKSAGAAGGLAGGAGCASSSGGGG
jgi:hypothetical protein